MAENNKSTNNSKKIVLPAVVLATSLYYSFSFTTGIAIGYIICKIFCNIFVKNGKIDPIFIDYGKWKIHLHHWIMGLVFLVLVWFIDYFYLPAFFTGVVCGIIIQDIYDYNDWYKVILNKEKYKNDTIV